LIDYEAVVITSSPAVHSTPV